MNSIQEFRQELANRLVEVEQEIKKLGGEPKDPVGDSFHLGQVGGSATTNFLRKQKDRYLETTINRAVKLVPLYKEREALENRLQHIDSGDFEKRVRQENKAVEFLLKYWEQLKPGDTFQPGSSVITIKRKNKNTVTDTNGHRWSRTEVLNVSKSRIAEIQAMANSLENKA